MKFKVETSRINFHIPTYLKDELVVVARHKGISTSELIKDLIKKELIEDRKNLRFPE